MGDIGIVGGPFSSFKYGGLTLHCKEDASPEVKTSNREYEGKLAGDGTQYSEATAIPGRVATDIVMSASEYKALIKKQDGKFRAGTISTANGDVYTLNCMINGECMLANGTVSLELIGKVRLQ